MMRTRNFRVRSEVVERGSVIKSQKGKKACVARKVGECFQWKAHGPKEAHVLWVMTNLAQGDLCSGQRREGRSSSPAPNSKAKTDEILKNIRQLIGKLIRQRSKSPCRYKNCKKNRHVNFGILGVPKLQVWDRMQIWKCFFRHFEAEEKPSKVKEMRFKRISCFVEGVYTIGLFFGVSIRDKSILRERGKLGSKHTVKFSKTAMRHAQIRERNGPSRGIIQKCEPHERSPCAPKFEEISHEETLYQERCARRVAWDLAKHIYKLKDADKATFLFSWKTLRRPRTLLWVGQRSKTASSRVSELQVWTRMCTLRQRPFPTCWGWRRAQQKVKERWC